MKIENVRAESRSFYQEELYEVGWGDKVDKFLFCWKGEYTFLSCLAEAARILGCPPWDIVEVMRMAKMRREEIPPTWERWNYIRNGELVSGSPDRATLRWRPADRT